MACRRKSEAELRRPAQVAVCALEFVQPPLPARPQQEELVEASSSTRSCAAVAGQRRRGGGAPPCAASPWHGAVRGWPRWYARGGDAHERTGAGSGDPPPSPRRRGLGFPVNGAFPASSSPASAPDEDAAALVLGFLPGVVCIFPTKILGGVLSPLAARETLQKGRVEAARHRARSS